MIRSRQPTREAAPPTPPPSPDLQAVRREGLTIAAVVEGLSMPTTFAFVDTDAFLILEKDSGRVIHVRRGKVVGTAIDLAVNAHHLRGALGIVAHPNFATNRFVYIFWHPRRTGEVAPEGADTAQVNVIDPQGARIDRFIWNGRTLRFDRNIFRFPSRVAMATSGVMQSEHNGGVLAFGPDGKLYAVTGDQARRGQLQNVPDGAQPANQNLTSVIVRLNDDGTIPHDNPFYDYGRSLGGEVGANVQRIFAYGIRNSFGMAFDPVAGHLWMHENGDDVFDEINRVVPGINSGWVQSMGPRWCYSEFRRLEIGSGDGLDRIGTFPPERLASSAGGAFHRLYQLPGSQYRDPLFSWRFNRGPSGLAFLSSRALGSELYGHLFVGEVYGMIYLFALTPDRLDLAFEDTRLMDRVVDNHHKADLTELDSLIFARGLGVVTELKVGPNGNLYVVSHSDGKVYRDPETLATTRQASP